MAKSKQLRVQLSFRRDDENLMNAYRYLKGRTDRTEYVAKLIIADMIGQSVQQEDGIGAIGKTTAQAAVPEIDYGKLIKMLQPTIDMLVSAAVSKAINSSPAAERQTGGIPIKDATPSQNADISLALEGLKAFSGFGGIVEGGKE